MNPALALVVFYLLLGVATLILRGDLAEWPRVVDRMLACLVCLGAVALLLWSWKGRQPSAGPADDGSSRPRPAWPWWLALAGLAAFVFVAVLPPVSVRLARPLEVQRVGPGEESPGPAPPQPSSDGSLPEIDPSGLGELGTREAAGDGAGKAAGEEGASLIERWRALARSRPPWLVALLAALVLLAAGLLWWLLRRRLGGTGRGGAREGPPPPWHDDPAAPAYVREFRRLCEHLGSPPRPGDTWRDLLARLPDGSVDPSSLEPVAVYHYRVRYEGADSDHAAEREFARLMRAVRKAATAAPATETAPAA